MIGTSVKFRPHRSVRQYVGQAGSEASKLALPWYVTDSLAKTIPAHLPDEYVVVGETTYEDGRRFLEFGVTTEYVEAVTSLRWDAKRWKFGSS